MTPDERWEIALTATCRLRLCAQAPGQRCVNTATGEPRDEPHWNRWALASRGDRS